jgi:hypothetical protein
MNSPGGPFYLSWIFRIHIDCISPFPTDARSVVRHILYLSTERRPGNIPEFSTLLSTILLEDPVEIDVVKN